MSNNSIKDRNSSGLVVDQSVQGYFFEELAKINNKFTKPVSSKIVYYLSFILENYVSSKNYFEKKQGKVKEKILGIRLLESASMSISKQKRILREIGDLSLFVCGYFSESLINKLVNVNYYREVGKISYMRLNKIIPYAYEESRFYEKLAIDIESAITILNIASKNIDYEDTSIIIPDIDKLGII